ncbi:MAG: hypothetical protein PF795_11700 [Kiritimatiellae bacterium]|jgi:hypothetical protein|nr:hypothetical protein [Kiritimatiellia bacterium]
MFIQLWGLALNIYEIQSIQNCKSGLETFVEVKMCDRSKWRVYESWEQVVAYTTSIEKKCPEDRIFLKMDNLFLNEKQITSISKSQSNNGPIIEVIMRDSCKWTIFSPSIKDSLTRLLSGDEPLRYEYIKDYYEI